MRILSKKRAIKEIHRLANQYIEKLRWHRHFFRKFNETQDTQYKVLKKILEKNKIKEIISILKNNESLLRKDHVYLSLRFLQILFLLWFLRFIPAILPLLIIFSIIKRRTFNVLKTDGSIFFEKETALCEIVINKKRKNKAQFSYTSIFKEQIQFVSNTTVGFSRRFGEIASSLMQSSAETISEFSIVMFSSRIKQTKASRELQEVIERCEAQKEKQIEELIIITEAVSNFNRERNLYYQQLLKIENEIEVSVKKGLLPIKAMEVSVFYESNYPIDERACMELLHLQSELANNYPRFSKITSLTLDKVNAYYEKSSAHHEKVLAIAEGLLPALDGLLRELQFRLNKDQEVAKGKLVLK